LVDAFGDVDTTTVIMKAAFDQQAIRSSTTDGTAFWVGGVGIPIDDAGVYNEAGTGSGGIWYIPYRGSVSQDMQLSSMPTRVVNIVGGQLYGTPSPSTSPPTVTPSELYAVGSGTPTSGTPTLVGLPGLPAGSSTASPWEFAFFDLIPSVPGLDTVYIATDQLNGATGGIEKWVSNGTTWSLATTFNLVTTAAAPNPDGFRGIAGLARSGTVTLMATTVESSTPGSSNRLVQIIDNGTGYAPAGQLTQVATVVATTAPDSLFRGVAMSPN
jgi:hypothetical protein